MEEEQSMLREELIKRGVPMPDASTKEDWIALRPQIKETILREVYGEFPHKPDAIEYKDVTQWGLEEVFMAGDADKYQIRVEITYDGRKGSFPFNLAIPKAGRPVPALVAINFESGSPYKYQPTEEIIDNGFAIAGLCYNDVTKDNDDFSDNIAGLIYNGEPRTATSPGKIAIWSWAASLVMDYLMTRPEIDHKNIAVIGHSRLGKTSLVTGAFDERFAFVIANDSGCGGAAISRGKGGESIEKIIDRFPYWFCLNYQKYVGKEYAMPIDQNWLLSLVAPRKLMIASASEDLWADPNSEYLGAFAASEIFKLYGLSFAGPDRFPVPGDSFYDGDVTYHQRIGKHYLSRKDWNHYLPYIRTHLNK